MPDSATLATALLLAAAAALLVAAMLYPSAMLRWFQRKRYQYEVTFSLYMLTSTEKFIFSMPHRPTQPIPTPTPYIPYPPIHHLRHNLLLNPSRTHTPLPLANPCRLGPLPPPQPPHYRRLAVPPRAPQHNRKPHLLLLQRQRERAFGWACRQGCWRSAGARRGVGGQWEGVC